MKLLQKAQRIAHFGWWERDFTNNHVFLSDEVCRIFGVEPVDLPEWHGRWLNLIHPEDRPRAAEEAAAALLRGGPRYDVEYRVIRPDGTERIVHSQGDVTWDDSGTASTPVWRHAGHHRAKGGGERVARERGALSHLRRSRD